MIQKLKKPTKKVKTNSNQKQRNLPKVKMTRKRKIRKKMTLRKTLMSSYRPKPLFQSLSVLRHPNCLNQQLRPNLQKKFLVSRKTTAPNWMKKQLKLLLPFQKRSTAILAMS
jgi:hypothetical protein